MTYTIPPATPVQNAVPLIQPYREALEFQQKRTPMLRGDYYSRAMDAARPRAFTITGLETYSSLLEAHRLGEEAIASNMTMSDYADKLGAIVDAHGGTVLPPDRFELIHHNTMANNNAAGAWKQMTDPEFVKDRPWFQYTGSANACKICSPLKGKIVHYTDPILRHMWAPNHHWCNCEWVSLATGDVDPKDVYRSPDGYDYPVINGQTVRPADGWDFHPAEVFGADDSAMRRAAAQLRLGEGHAKTSADYGLAPIAEIAALPKAPRVPDAIRELQSERARFDAIFGVPAGAKRTIAIDYARDGLWITGDTFEAMAGAAGDDADQVFALAAAVFQEPVEVWFVPAALPGGGTVFVKRYLGAFAGEEGDEPIAVYLDRSPDGWAMAGGRLGSASALEALRRGLLTYTRAGRKP